MITTARRIWTLSTVVGLAWLTLQCTAHAQPVVTPAKGTVGTTFEVTGADFGSKKGKVYIGKRICDVVSWSDTSIQCEIKFTMKAGAYDLTVKPNQASAAPIVVPGGFNIMAPKLNPPTVRPRFVTPRSTVTLDGAYFGPRGASLKVFLEDLQGKKKDCAVVNRTTDSLTVKLPTGFTGLVHLHVKNSMGEVIEPYWGTFAAPPQMLPQATSYTNYSHSGAWTGENAAAVVYQNKLWVFYPEDDHDGNTVQYVIWDGASTWSGEYTVTCNGSVQKSYAPPTPIVANETLYVFFTGLGGYLDYVVYNPTATDPNQQWQGMYRVPSAKLGDVNGRFAAVHNSTVNRIEIYWTPDYTNVYMKTWNLNNNSWAATQTVGIAKTQPTIASYLTAVFNRLGEDDYVTYLSWNDGYAGYLGELKDGRVLQYTSLWYWDAKNVKRGPSLVDLGEDYLAVLYNHWGDQSSYQKYNKKNHAVVAIGQGYEQKVPFISSQETAWAPTGVTFSTKVDDASSPTKYRMNTFFYAIVGDNPEHDPTHWQLVQCEYLGYWMPTNSGNNVNFSADNQVISSTFHLWPVLGVIDMPPFVLNGRTEPCLDAHACSVCSAEMSFELAQSTGIAGEYSVGAYVETGKRSKVTMEMSAGYTGGFEKSTNFSFKMTGGIENNMAGEIAAYYLAPQFRVYNLEWFDLNGKPTGLFATSFEVTGATIRKETFEPEPGPIIAGGTVPLPYLDPQTFPVHVGATDIERLETYKLLDPGTNGENIVNSLLNNCVVAKSSPCDFNWEVQETEGVDNGFYVEMKLGYEVAHTIGFGAEGSFEMHITTSTEKTVKAITQLYCPDPLAGFFPYIKEYAVYGYWLKPSATGYWVPENRKGLGDTPWFVTYRVGDYWPIFQ